MAQPLQEARDCHPYQVRRVKAKMKGLRHKKVPNLFHPNNKHSCPVSKNKKDLLLNPIQSKNPPHLLTS